MIINMVQFAKYSGATHLKKCVAPNLMVEENAQSAIMGSLTISETGSWGKPG
jgi:hypothetical protein